MLFRPLTEAGHADRLARTAGWWILMAGLIVVLMGASLGHQGSMIEGTVLAVLALFAGWMRSRWLAIPLLMLIAFGFFTSVVGGAPLPVVIFSGVMMFIAIRLLEATFRFPAGRSAGPQ
ncbi:MAG: hypothetical protein ACK4IT_03230 [Thioalkalivibrionaceae bacterium]